MLRGICVVASVTLTAAACERTEEAPLSLVEDSAGVVVVDSPSPSAAVTASWRAGPVTVTLGRGATELNDIVGVARLSDGSFAVADAGNARVLFFDSEGAWTGTAGGPGDGPGEFGIIQTIGSLPGDSVWVYDFSHARVTVFSPDRSRGRVMTLSPPVPAGLAVGMLADGSFLVGESWSTTGVASSTTPGRSREPVAYVRYDVDGSFADTLATIPGREVVLWREESGRGVMSAAPFGRHAVHGLLGDRVVLGDQVTHELRILDMSGAPTRIVRWNGGDLKLSTKEVDAWREERLSAVDPEDRPRVRAELDDLPIPERRPAYDRIVVDEVGRLWVSDFPHPGDAHERWNVFDPDGAWLTSVEMPERFRLLGAGSAELVGVQLSPLDEQSVVVRALLEGR